MTRLAKDHATFVDEELAALLETDFARHRDARPQLWIIAGPNGAGKSTLVRRQIAGRLPVINPDDIAIGLPRRRDGKVNEMAAGRQALQERQAMLGTGCSFAVETTLTGSNPLRFMAEAAQCGYHLTLVYIGARQRCVVHPARSRPRGSRGARRAGRGHNAAFP